MKTYPIHNSNPKDVIYVGNRMILPLETQVFEEHELPPGYKPDVETAPHDPAKAAPAPSPVAAIAALAVKGVQEKLPTLETNQLDELETLEEQREQGPRTTVLGAIRQERIRRLVEMEADLLVNQLTPLDDDTLGALEKAEEARGQGARKPVLEAIQKEQLQRGEVAKLKEEIAGHDLEALQDLLTATTEGSVEYGLIAEEIERRTQEGGQD